MAGAKVGSAKWRFGQSLFFVFAFIPFLQWIPCFVMNGRIPKRKWLMMGFINILLFFALVAGQFMCENWKDNHRIDYPESPSERDYIGEDAYFNMSYEEREKLPEYQEYERALEDYFDSDEYKEISEKNYAIYQRSDEIQTILSVALFVAWLMYFILLFFVERYRYLEELATRENRRGVYEAVSRTTEHKAEHKAEKPSQRLADALVGDVPNTEDTAPEENVSAPVIETLDNNDSAADKLNINTATEEQIQSLPGLSVIDVKKIMEYRSKKGHFTSVDEVFDSFSARPHIIVKLQDKITVDDTKKQETTPNSSAKRRFDI